MKGIGFDKLYPGNYIKAAEFHGKSPTLTIKSVAREMLSNGRGGEEGAVIVAFAEVEKKWVMVKTNGVCLRALWGDDEGEWVGHKITLHAVPDTSGLSESGLCIRVKGSPELAKPLRFKAQVGLTKLTQTLVPTAKKPEAMPEPELPKADDDDDDDIGFPDLDDDDLAAALNGEDAS